MPLCPYTSVTLLGVYSIAMDNLSLITNLSLAALLIIVGYLLARQALPILDRMATAMTKHLAGIDTALRGINDTLEDLRIMLETDMRVRGHDPVTRRHERRNPPDENHDAK